MHTGIPWDTGVLLIYAPCKNLQDFLHVFYRIYSIEMFLHLHSAHPYFEMIYFSTSC